MPAAYRGMWSSMANKVRRRLILPFIQPTIDYIDSFRLRLEPDNSRVLVFVRKRTAESGR